MSVKALRNSLMTALLATASACSYDGPAPKKSDGSANSTASNLAPSKKVIVTQVSVILDLDTEDFRVNGLRVGMQDFMTSTSPVVTYMMPSRADYAELLRCNANAVIKGVSGDVNLKDVQLGMSTADETRLMQSQDFWQGAIDAGCVLVTDALGDPTYLDAASPSGTFSYLARSCVWPARVSDTNYSNRNCSMFVSASPSQSYTNKRVAAENAALDQVRQMQSRITSLGLGIYNETITLNNALIDCNAIDNADAASALRKSAIANLINIGANIGGKFITEAAAAGTAGGTSIGSAIANLFTSSKDFPRSCTIAEKAREDAATASTEMAADRTLLTNALAAADAAGKARQTVEGK